MRPRSILTILALVVLATSGCALNLPAPPTNAPFTIDRPPQDVWDSALDVFALAGIIFETVETDSYLLASSGVPLRSGDVTCKAWNEIAWMTVTANRAMSRTTIRLRPQPNSTGTVVVMSVDAWHPDRDVQCQEKASAYRRIRNILDPTWKAYTPSANPPSTKETHQ